MILLTMGCTSYGGYLLISRFNGVNTGLTFHRSVRKILGRQITSQTQKSCDGLDWQKWDWYPSNCLILRHISFLYADIKNISTLYKETLTSQNIEWRQLWTPCKLSFPQPTTEC